MQELIIRNPSGREEELVLSMMEGPVDKSGAGLGVVV